jgi:hypothetical protein
MKMCPVEVQMFHADEKTDRQTDRHDENNSHFFVVIRTSQRAVLFSQKECFGLV